MAFIITLIILKLYFKIWIDIINANKTKQKKTKQNKTKTKQKKAF
jgi:hypothetical protein